MRGHFGRRDYLGFAEPKPSNSKKDRPKASSSMTNWGNGADGSVCCEPAKVESLSTVSCCSTDVHARLADLLAKYDVDDYAASVKMYAVKP
jgi:arsenite methyltransferase